LSINDFEELYNLYMTAKLCEEINKKIEQRKIEIDRENKGAIIFGAIMMVVCQLTFIALSIYSFSMYAIEGTENFLFSGLLSTAFLLILVVIPTIAFFCKIYEEDSEGDNL